MESFHVAVLALAALAVCMPFLTRIAQRLGIFVSEPPAPPKWRARGWLPFNARITVALLVLVVLCRGHRAYPHVFVLALCHLALRFAYTLPQLHGVNRLGDYCYGLYLWTFPMQQLVVFALQPSTPTRPTLMALPLALAYAMASWHGLEKPAPGVLRRWRERDKAEACVAT